MYARWLLLSGISVAPIILSFTGKILNDTVYFAGLETNYLCYFRANYGINCPTCGLTRGWVCVSDFDLNAAAVYNPHSLNTYLAVFFISVVSALLSTPLIQKPTIRWLTTITIPVSFGLAWVPIIIENLAFYRSLGIGFF